MKKILSKVKNFFGLDDNEFDDNYEAVSDESTLQEETKARTQHPKNVRQEQIEEPVQPEVEVKKSFRFPVIGDEEVKPKTQETPMQKAEKPSKVFVDPREDDTLHLPKHLPGSTKVFDVEVSGIRELLEKRNRNHGKSSVVRLHRQELPTSKTRNVTREEAVFLTDHATHQEIPKREENPAFVNPIQNKKRFVPTHVPSPVYGFQEPKPIGELLNEDLNIDLNIPVVFNAEEVVLTDKTSKDQQEQIAAEVQSNVVETDIVEPTQVVETVEQTKENEPQTIHVAAIEREDVEELTKTEASTDVQKINELQLQNVTFENSTVHIGQIHVEPAPTVEKTIVQERVVTVQSSEMVTQSSPQNEQNISEEIKSVKTNGGSKLPFNVLMLKSDKDKMKGTPFQQIKTGVPHTIVEKVELRHEAQSGQQTTDSMTNTPYTADAQSTTHDSTEAEEIAIQQQVVMSGTPTVAIEASDNEVEVLDESLLETAEVTNQQLAPTNLMEPQNAEATLLATQEIAASDESNFMQEKQELDDMEQRLLANFQASIQGGESELSAEIEPQNVAQTAIAILEVETERQQAEIGEQSTHQLEVPQPQSEQVQRLLKRAQTDTVELATDSIEVKGQSVEATHELVTETEVFQLGEQALDVQSLTSIVPSERTSNTPTSSQYTRADVAQQEVAVTEVEPVKEVKPYEKPSLDILVPPEEKTEDWAWMDEQAEYLIAALASHQITAQIESIVQGPAVTQFEITVAAGTKVSKVRNLSDDIKLALAAKDIRIDAPIPGKRTIGIEIPNRISRAVRLSEVTDSEVFQQSDSPLEAALGLDLNGKPVTLDLRKMPHGLIAGATGSGKSVCINSILVSLLYKADPHELKLMLIDPKMVELAPFNHIPHLVSPVITDVKAATAALKWAVEEMERRYQLFMHAGVRDITRYNSQAEKAGQFAQKMPYILIVIDELADLMMMSPADVEEAICRIAQKARACGIHLIVATQRPSVDVITGLIKSNIPTRIAFAVSSAIDSRTILDMQGAERLLGRGDMLYLGNGMPAPIRLQGTFVTDDEIEEIIEYVRSQGDPDYIFQHDELLKKAEFIEEQDELFEEVCRYVFEQGTASTSSIQRRYHIGYNRAARLVDMLEGHGFVSEQRGSKPREVFITEADLESLFS